MLTQLAQHDDKVACRGQGERVVLAQRMAGAGQCLLGECGGRRCSPSSRSTTARLLAEARVLGWSSPSTRREQVRVSSVSARACARRSWCAGGDQRRAEQSHGPLHRDAQRSRSGISVRNHGAAVLLPRPLQSVCKQALSRILDAAESLLHKLCLTSSCDCWICLGEGEGAFTKINCRSSGTGIGWRGGTGSWGRSHAQAPSQEQACYPSNYGFPHVC